MLTTVQAFAAAFVEATAAAKDVRMHISVDFGV
jgi:hypothetical protein